MSCGNYDLLLPGSVASITLSNEKSCGVPASFVSHGDVSREIKNADQMIVIRSDSDSIDIPCAHCLLDLTLVIDFHRDCLINGTGIVWTMSNTTDVKMPLSTMRLLNRTLAPFKNAIRAANLVSSKFYSSTFTILRRAGFAKLECDLILAFVAIADADYAVDKYPLSFLELRKDAGLGDYLRLRLNAALPLGKGAPMLPTKTADRICISSDDGNDRDLLSSNPISLCFLAYCQPFSEHVVECITNNPFQTEKFALQYSGGLIARTHQISRAEFRVHLFQAIPVLAYLIYFGDDVPDNIHTIELCFPYYMPVTSCKTTVNDLGKHKISYSLCDCLIENNWIVLPIDRSLSIHDALHESNFVAVPDYLDTLLLPSPPYLCFANNNGLAIDMPPSVFISARVFNVVRYAAGIYGSLFLTK